MARAASCHLDSRRARFACWSSSGRGGPSTESSCSVINSWNKFTAAARLSQNEHRTRVKCRMWICSEMLVLTWMYFSSHRPLHLLLALYNQNLSFGQKITDSADHTQEKWDHKHHPNHQPCLLPNFLMTKACERSALYHDRRTQRHETPKAML